MLTKTQLKKWIIYHVKTLGNSSPIGFFVLCEEDAEMVARWMLDLGIDHNVYTPDTPKNTRLFTFIREDFLKKAEAIG